MGHDISDATKFRHSAVFQRFEGDALAAVLEREADRRRRCHRSRAGESQGTRLRRPRVRAGVGGDEGGVGGARSPDHARARASSRAKPARAASSSTFTADHGMPGEPRPGGRHYMDDISALIDKRFSPSGGTVVQYYNDAANNEIHLDTASSERLASR